MLPGGETAGPRGNTANGLVNVLGVIPKTALFDAATWAGELVWAHLVSVKSGGNLFNGEGYAPVPWPTSRRPEDKWDGCTTSNYFGMSAAFTPTWYQVFPGVDLSAPLAVFARPVRQCADRLRRQPGQRQLQHRPGRRRVPEVPLRPEVHRLLRPTTKDNGTAVTAQNGFTTLLKDRGSVYLTFKTTF